MSDEDKTLLKVPHVRITADPHRFAPLLGGGFRLNGAGGLALEAFLVAEAEIPADYLRERVQTLFMDGRPVDDAGTAVVREGGVISLSAAMPGLAGAVLRRSGVYAAMRRSISHDPAAPASRDRSRIDVTLKLFNLIARELGPGFLARGIVVDSGELRDFLDRQGRWLWAAGDTAAIDGRETAPAGVAAALPAAGNVRLQVTPR
jgi:hypothetical protein